MLVHGKKVKRIPVGWAVDICPICRDVRAFSVKDVRSVSHFYFVSLGRGTSIVLELTCHECGVLIARKRETCRLYHDSELAGVRAAISTSPSPTLIARQSLEERLLDGTATRQERIHIMAEPFQQLLYLTTLKMKKGPSASISAILQLLLIIAAIATPIIVLSPARLSTTIPVVAATAVLLYLVIARAIDAPKAAARKYALPHIARSFVLLQPTRDELEEVLASQRALSTARHLTPDLILTAIDREILNPTPQPAIPAPVQR